MKKLIVALMLFGSVSAQDKKDTTVEVRMSLDQFRALLYTIDTNIDSKKASKELIDFLSKNVQIVQPADKPKK
jgi:hypothetical protein